MYIKMNNWLPAIAITLFLTGNFCTAGEQKSNELRKELEAAALAEIESTKTPSLQISVGKGSKILFEGAFGLADIENDVKATPKTKYRTASVAKWFTATAAMRLTQNGTLDLDKPVQTYCSDFSNKNWPITPKQLLTHTSGIRHYLDYDEKISAATSEEEKEKLKQKEAAEIISSYTRYTDVISPLNTFKEDPLLFEPGTAWEYSSFGYRLLACVLQGAANANYVDLMQDLVFEPSGMGDTLPDDARKIIPHRASGYQLERGMPLSRAELRDVSENLPAGGYLSTATDLVKFALQFHTELISDKNRILMSSPVIGELDSNSPASWRDAIPQQDKYGYGLMLFSKYEKDMVGHTGRQDGGAAILVLLPEKNIAIAIMTNAKGWNGYLNFVMKVKAISEKYI